MLLALWLFAPMGVQGEEGTEFLEPPTMTPRQVGTHALR